MNATAAEIAMPRLSDSMEEGTVLTWLKKVGEDVAVGEALVEIETDKANMSYEADVAGTLVEILVAEGETAPVGSPIARIGDSAEGRGAPSAGPVADATPTVLGSQAASAPRGTPASAPPPAGAPGSQQTPTPRDKTPTESAPAEDAAPVKASPLARRLARERAVDLATLRGSGPGGRVVKKDVELAVSPVGGAGAGVPRGAQEPQAPSTVGVAPATGPAGETAKGESALEELSKLQQVVARRMSEAKATVPHFQVETEARVDALLAYRTRLKQAGGEQPAPSLNDFVIRASALALRAFPKANGSYRDARFELHSRVNVGIAVAAEGALVVPTITDADRRSVAEIGHESRRLAERVRAGEITPPELAGGTFTVSNLGMFGMTAITPVINLPQAAILGVGASRPVLRREAAGEIVDAAMITLTLSCDHRILYGAEAAEFLAEIKRLLEEPLLMA